LRRMDQNWYMVEDMNGKKLRKFSPACRRRPQATIYAKVLMGYFFDSPYTLAIVKYLAPCTF